MGAVFDNIGEKYQVMSARRDSVFSSHANENTSFTAHFTLSEQRAEGDSAPCMVNNSESLEKKIMWKNGY